MIVIIDISYIVFRNRSSNQTVYNITFPENTTCDLLVIGGGGASGNFGSGTGAGDVLYFKNVSMSSGKYVIKVGKGGVTGRSDTNVSYIAGYSGENSSIKGGTLDITAG